MQGTPTARANGATLDLDAILAARELKPQTVKLGGKNYTIRRDLTGPQVRQYWDLVKDGKDVDALALICNAPVALNRALEKLPREHMEIAVREIMQAAGIVTARGDAGE